MPYIPEIGNENLSLNAFSFDEYLETLWHTQGIHSRDKKCFLLGMGRNCSPPHYFGEVGSIVLVYTYGITYTPTRINTISNTP